MKLICLAALAAGTATCAQAQESGPWSLRLGLSHIQMDESADISLGGAPVPGASFTTGDDVTPTFGIGYRFSERFSAELTVGVPPTAALTGTGPLAGLALGEVTYGPATLTGLYHFPKFGNGLEAYVGGGINYTLIFDTKDGAISDFDVDNAFAPVVQAGVEGPLGHRTGWVIDLKYIPLETKARGTVGGAPAEADITLNPLIATAGIVVRF